MIVNGATAAVTALGAVPEVVVILKQAPLTAGQIVGRVVGAVAGVALFVGAITIGTSAIDSPKA